MSVIDSPSGSEGYNARWVAEALRIPLSNSLDGVNFPTIVTDSRKIQPGCLFVALAGEKFDGHDFIDQALSQGARGVVARKDRLPKTLARICLFGVEDTLLAYQELGKAWRARFSIPVVLVAGSNGKTTTKELIFAILQGKWPKVLKTQGSQNGYVGIPLTLLDLTSSHLAAVIEVGIDEPGAMKRHIDLVQPTAAVLTVVEPEHLEKLIDLDTVAREEGFALTETAAREGSVAINCDDPRIEPHFHQIHSDRKLGYSLQGGQSGASSPYRIYAKITDDSSHLEVSGQAFKSSERFELPLPGRHNATNLLSAIAVTSLLGLSPNEMRSGLRTFMAPEGRSQVRTLPDGTRVICDYYNSQPASLRAGLELLKELPGASSSTPRWACLADMLELGPREEGFHREPAQWITSLGIQNILLYGSRMRWLADELRKSGYSGSCRHFSGQAEMADVLSREAVPGSVILIKGSNSMKMGEVWKLFEQARGPRGGSNPIGAP